MIRFFKKRQAKGRRFLPHLVESAVLKLQSKVCHFLQPKVNSLNKRWVYGAFVFVVAVYTFFSGRIIWKVFFGESAAIEIKTGKVVCPPVLNEPEEINSQPRINEKGIKGFKGLLDSLSSVNPKAYDSLLTVRPGLLDSLDKIQKIIE